ncbi:MAG: glycosyltransferase [Actinomycetota bacterium]|nr:glycosyltransferase [Actinomycetota bacterium]
MSSPPTVSVIIPTRDRPELLRRAIRRVCEQRFDGGIECLVVFDQSEPNLPDVEVPDGVQLRALSNRRKPGLAGARNSGALEANGELLAFCDDDDEWLPDKLAHQVTAFEEPGVRVVATGIEVHYEERRFDRLSPRDTVTFDELLESRRTDVHPSTFLISKTAFLDEIGFVDEDLPGSYAEDYEWLLRAARLGPIRTLREPLVRVHWHKSSYFSDRWQMIASALSYLLEQYPEFKDHPRGFARVAGQIAFAHGAAGNRSEARAWARRTFSANWRQPRSYLALAVSAGLPAQSLLRLAHMAGRGI